MMRGLRATVTEATDGEWFYQFPGEDLVGPFATRPTAQQASRDSLLKPKKAKKEDVPAKDE